MHKILMSINKCLNSLLISGYQSVLRRMTNHSSFTVLHECDEDSASIADQYNQLAVRYTLFATFFTQRMSANHRFFCQYLPVSAYPITSGQSSDGIFWGNFPFFLFFGGETRR